jgi:putative spermidine/putrescine transport system permease protein
MKATYSNRWGMLIFYGLCGLILFFLIFPIFVIFPVSLSSARYLTFPPPGFSFQWYLNFFSRTTWKIATLLSFHTAILVMILSTVLGTLASLGIVRGKFPGKSLAYAFIVSPLVIPIIIIALASYFLVAKLKLIGSPFGLAFIHTVIAVPVVVVIVSNTLRNFDTTLEKASMIMGAGRIKTFFKVTFPLIKTGIFSAAFFAFLTSFDELIIALFVGGTTAVTLPRRMWEGVRMEIDPTIAAVATLLTLFSICVLGLIIKIQSVAEKRRR